MLIVNVAGILDKVEVTLYLRSRNELKLFRAKKLASDWLTNLVNESEALAGNSLNSFLDLRYELTTTLEVVATILTFIFAMCLIVHGMKYCTVFPSKIVAYILIYHKAFPSKKHSRPYLFLRYIY